MPVYLITLHAYGTWMPDRPRGYYHHARGLCKPSVVQAKQYRDRQAHRPARFDNGAQRVLIHGALDASTAQGLRLYFVATESAHLHVLVGWSDSRWAESIRARLKQSLSRALNTQVDRRTWFVRNGWVERVRQEEHFNHLTEKYLTSHPGWTWHWKRGWIEPPGTDREPSARG